ncbi:MAG: LysR family transcriptional regulator [Rhodobacteraceae bacterium]|uniref:LysR substrate-binding domain-containing protein n=1 Tax=Tabrizicola sp. SY72 TaxID=2741673 RepID=UPI001571B1F6|nr:LysR substrate-binding domain-containing protein [Tabrizicola sp. SY72]MBL9055286.1 LysR family transcriptional regulator [Paracoccaceae bacterium]NTT84925.1 LysR family transcriptional regulator [Tabrizicola sp. SY72]
MPLRFTLRQLEYLVAVGEAGSIALASERVNISSPSISAAIAQLEAEFGLALFVRKHAHGLTLTQGGRQFMAQAKAVLAEAARLNDLAGEITGQVRGPLSVGCLQTFAQVLLPQLRRGFVDAFPQVEFRQAELNQTEIFEGLRGATLDVALIYDLDIPSDIFFLPLITLPPYAVLQADHPLARQTSVSPADLAPLPMVLLDLPFSTDYFLSVFTRAGLRPRIVERTRDMGVMRAMVANGFGYSIANIRPVTDQAPDGGRLAHVPLAGPVRPLQLGLAVMAGAGLALTVQAFVDHARATLTPGTA